MQQGQRQTFHYTLVNQKALSPDDAELYELASLTGMVIDQHVFKIIMDLLRMNVAPTAIERMLKSIISTQKKHHTAVGWSGNVPVSSISAHGTATSHSIKLERRQ